MPNQTTPGAPVFREAKLNLYRPANPIVGRTHKNVICTVSKKAAGFVRHLEIDVSGTELAGNCQAGQAIGIIAPGENEKGKPHKVRLYSLCSPSPGEGGNPNIVATTVKRLIDENWEDHSLFLGVASNYICDLTEGDEVLLTGPAGKRFLLPQDIHAHEYMFFATGTGIAPFRAMVLELLEAGCKGRITLVMGSPYASDLLYHADFLELQTRHDNFTYLTAISREQQEDGNGRLYVQERISTNREQLAPQLASDSNLIYICGLTGMEIGIFQEMAKVIEVPDLEQYLQIEPELLDDIQSWNRKMMPKRIKTTERVLMEVYD